MTARIVTASEHAHRLVGTELAAVVPLLPPSALVVVVEEGDALLGCFTLVPLYHFEAFWIAPQSRKKAGVFRALIRALGRLSHELGFQTVLAGALDSQVDHILRRLGALELPGRHYAWKVRT